MTDPTTAYTAALVERTVVITWPDNDRGGATPPPDGWQEKAWAQEPTLHEIDEGSVSGCSALRWRNDPRSDAELLAVSLTLVGAAPAVVPSVGGAALRDRVRRAVCEAEGFAWDSDMLEPDEYGDVADAVLAVLPAPADRAAVLTDAADAVVAVRDAEYGPGEFKAEKRALNRAIERLRRLAGEAAPDNTETPSVALGRQMIERMADRVTESGTCTNCRGSGLDPRRNGDFACSDCPPDDEAPTAETVHGCPPDGSGVTPCCGRTPFELPRTDRMSTDSTVATCRADEPGGA
ncbi:hypothetical protein [Streptomyces caniscabiei]|uniref:hypothetical protein n=1 Tax=Streptomyces caniscabiei TaxID=2746961 RepID=UPI000765B8F2|nr:hypothetical protein [Streptomyces caniscabiei]